MKRVVRTFLARPRMTLSLAFGVAAALLLPGAHTLVTRGLLGWNVAVWVYLLMIGLMMKRADHERLRRAALAHAEGAGPVLATVILSALASLVGIVVELAAAKVPGAPHALPHVLFALSTIVGAWLLLPTLFALNYTSAYYRAPVPGGLRFAGEGDEAERPGYDDFLYFSFTIAVASQTSDVAVTTRAMRRLVLLQSLLSFVFNTAILAFTINIAAGML